ncbi:hypothetical protein EAE96_003694 [Botrytis aclada]|nr:hypothetical protein EAE96_003694 [Botrytis aclada]
MAYVRERKTPVPRCIVPSFSNQVFYPGSAPAGVTPEYFTTLNVYQQWLQIFGPDVPLPEDERNMPGYPQFSLWTETGEEGPRYRYCSKERAWKLRSLFPMSNGRILSSCSHCRLSQFRRIAKQQGISLEQVIESKSQELQRNQDVAEHFSQPRTQIVNTGRRKRGVADLPLMPQANPYAAESVPNNAMPAPVSATPALGPSEEITSKFNQFRGIHFETERLHARLVKHERMKKFHEANLEKLKMEVDLVREGSEDNIGKKMAEVARVQGLISKENDILIETQSELEDANLSIALITEMDNADIGYQNNNEGTVLPSIEEEWDTAPFISPENFDNASEAGFEFTDQTDVLLRFSPTPQGYPPLDEDGHVLSNNDPFMPNPSFASGLDGMAEKESGDEMRDLDIHSPLHTLDRVSVGIPHANSYLLLQNQATVEPHPQQLLNFQAQDPQPQEEVDYNRFRELSIFQENQDQNAQPYQAQSRQRTPCQRHQLPARTPSTFREVDPSWQHQASGQNSSCLQSLKATNAAAQHAPLTAHALDLNPNLVESPNPTAIFQFGQSTLGGSGQYGSKIKEDVARYQTLASQKTRETAQQAQRQQIRQYQGDKTTGEARSAQKAKEIYDPIAQQSRQDQESQESYDELAQEQLSRKTRTAQQSQQACDQLAPNQLIQEQLAENAKKHFEQRAQQTELSRKASLAHNRVTQEQPAQKQLAQPIELLQISKQACDQLDQNQMTLKQLAEKARDVYDQRAYEIRTQQNGPTLEANVAYEQMDQDETNDDDTDDDELYRDELYQYEMDLDNMNQDQLAQKAIDARDIYDQRANEMQELKMQELRNELAEHVHHVHDQLLHLSQQTQLALEEQQETRAQKAEYLARLPSHPFQSLPTFHTLPICESPQPIQTPKRRAEDSPVSPNQPEPEDLIRRSKRARHRAETEMEMREREDMRAERAQRRAEILELQQIEKATKLSLENLRRCEKG